MRIEVVDGLEMAARRWTKVLLVMLLIVLPCIAISVTVGELADQVSVADAARGLEKADAVAFTTFYSNRGVSNVSATSLAAEIKSGGAYSTVLFNTGDDSGRTSDGHRLIYVIGTRAAQIFPALGACGRLPCAMRGGAVRAGPRSAVMFNGRRYSPDHAMPRGASILDPNAGVISLDSAIVLALPASAVTHLSAEAKEEAASRLVLLHPSSASVDRYVDETAESGLDLVPQKVDGLAAPALRQAVFEAALFIAGSIAFLLLVLLTYAAAVARLVAEQRRTAAIRYMYGGSLAGTRIRFASFIACLASGPVLALLALSVLSRSQIISSTVYATLAFLAAYWCLLWAWVTRSAGDSKNALGGV